MATTIESQGEMFKIWFGLSSKEQERQVLMKLSEKFSTMKYIEESTSASPGIYAWVTVLDCTPINNLIIDIINETKS